MASVKIDWESLPVKRDQSKVEYKSYSYGTYNSKGYSSYEYEYSKYEKSGGSVYDSWSGWDKSPARSRRKNYKKDCGYYDDFYYEDEDHCAPSGKSYLNDLDTEIQTESPTSKNYYESLKQNLLDDRFTNEDVQKISEQYFDFTNNDHKQSYMDLTDLYDDEGPFRY
jgi:hypothetical protein